MVADALYDIINGCVIYLHAVFGMQDAEIGVKPCKTAHNTPRHNPPLLVVGKLCRKQILDIGI